MLDVNEMIDANESLYACVLGGDINDEEEMILAFVDAEDLWEYRG